MACPRPPFLMRKLSFGDAAARPRWRAHATPFLNDQDSDNRAVEVEVEVARSRHSVRKHLNEGYFGDFTFSDQGPAISQAQFDTYRGRTAEDTTSILPFHQF
ncbi:hypothetical protein PIB30_086901 [Stylosanthes scabra]|uniref:Uncharacterized protein n=1 Tax=Stylosanthes scabra TaxID=79078 RepID=A0ABU6SUR2_9FABA|nr:hypothetical protein [Stylosanthes scabra]